MSQRTLRLLPFEFCSASKPPGPRLLLRDFFSLGPDLPTPEAPGIVIPSAVEFSLSAAAAALGTWAIERRERTLVGSREAIATGYDAAKT